MFLPPPSQLVIQTSDLGEPTPCTNRQNATVRVRVVRNEFAPVFSNSGSYTARVEEDAGVDVKVVTIRTDDKDSKVGEFL